MSRFNRSVITPGFIALTFTLLTGACTGGEDPSAGANTCPLPFLKDPKSQTCDYDKDCSTGFVCVPGQYFGREEGVCAHNSFNRVTCDDPTDYAWGDNPDACPLPPEKDPNDPYCPGYSECSEGFKCVSGWTFGLHSHHCVPNSFDELACGNPDPTGELPTTTNDPDLTTGIDTDSDPTTGVDTDPTTGNDTDSDPTTGVDTDSNTDTGQETDTDSNTDTGEECQVITCDDLPLTKEGRPAGRPTCDDGLQYGELIESVMAFYQEAFPWITECYTGDPTDFQAFALWLGMTPENFDPNANATQCDLDKLKYLGGPILALQSDPDGNYGLGETEKVATRYCFSGAHAQDMGRHIAKLFVVNMPVGKAVDLPPNVTVRLQCEGNQSPVVLEGGQGFNAVDCSTPDGVAGSFHIEVDIAEQGGQIGDQFRLWISVGQTGNGLPVHVAGDFIPPLWTLQ